MDWKTPIVVEIKMDAEIGSYQEDDGERAPGPYSGPSCSPVVQSQCVRPHPPPPAR